MARFVVYEETGPGESKLIASADTLADLMNALEDHEIRECRTRHDAAVTMTIGRVEWRGILTDNLVGQLDIPVQVVPVDGYSIGGVELPVSCEHVAGPDDDGDDADDQDDDDTPLADFIVNGGSD